MTYTRVFIYVIIVVFFAINLFLPFPYMTILFAPIGQIRYFFFYWAVLQSLPIATAVVYHCRGNVRRISL